MTNIATLGFEFNSSTAIQEIKKIEDALRNLTDQKEQSQKNMTELFSFKNA